MSDSIFDFNLVEFEQEFLAGKYDHLISQIKKPKALQGGKKKQVAIRIQPTIPRVEFPVPVSLVEQYITYTCKACNCRSRILTQTLIKYQKRGSFIYRAITEANITDTKNLTSGEEFQETHTVIEMCANCSEVYFPLEDVKEEAFQAFSDTILPQPKPEKVYPPEEKEDDEQNNPSDLSND
jgi:hypothetical protein